MNRNNQSFSERMEAAKARLPATAGKHYPRPVRARDYWGDPNSDDMLDAAHQTGVNAVPTNPPLTVGDLKVGATYQLAGDEFGKGGSVKVLRVSPGTNYAYIQYADKPESLSFMVRPHHLTKG